MVFTTTAEGLKQILREAREQFVQMCLCNPAGQWSTEYYTLDQLRENRRGFDSSTMLVLRSEKDSACHVIDASLISAIRFNKYLQYQGGLVHEVNIHRKNRTGEILAPASSREHLERL